MNWTCGCGATGTDKTLKRRELSFGSALVCPSCGSIHNWTWKKEMKLRVWHIPQVPGKPFHVDVSSIEEAKKVRDILADYDKFQFENNIKGDYANASGLEALDFYPGQPAGEWEEWEDENGNDINS